jgi:hypothetical protein
MHKVRESLVVQAAAVKRAFAAVEALSQKERHDEAHREALSLLPKLVEKLVWVPIIFVM